MYSSSTNQRWYKKRPQSPSPGPTNQLPHYYVDLCDDESNVSRPQSEKSFTQPEPESAWTSRLRQPHSSRNQGGDFSSSFGTIDMPRVLGTHPTHNRDDESSTGAGIIATRPRLLGQHYQHHKSNQGSESPSVSIVVSDHPRYLDNYKRPRILPPLQPNIEISPASTSQSERRKRNKSVHSPSGGGASDPRHYLHGRPTPQPTAPEDQSFMPNILRNSSGGGANNTRNFLGRRTPLPVAYEYPSPVPNVTRSERPEKTTSVQRSNKILLESDDEDGLEFVEAVNFPQLPGSNLIKVNKEENLGVVGGCTGIKHAKASVYNQPNPDKNLKRNREPEAIVVQDSDSERRDFPGQPSISSGIVGKSSKVQDGKPSEVQDREPSEVQDREPSEVAHNDERKDKAVRKSSGDAPQFMHQFRLPPPPPNQQLPHSPSQQQYSQRLVLHPNGIVTTSAVYPFAPAPLFPIYTLSHTTKRRNRSLPPLSGAIVNRFIQPRPPAVDTSMLTSADGSTTNTPTETEMYDLTVPVTTGVVDNVPPELEGLSDVTAAKLAMLAMAAEVGGSESPLVGETSEPPSGGGTPSVGGSHEPPSVGGSHEPPSVERASESGAL